MWCRKSLNSTTCWNCLDKRLKIELSAFSLLFLFFFDFWVLQHSAVIAMSTCKFMLVMPQCLEFSFCLLPSLCFHFFFHVLLSCFHQSCFVFSVARKKKKGRKRKKSSKKRCFFFVGFCWNLGFRVSCCHFVICCLFFSFGRTIRIARYWCFWVFFFSFPLKTIPELAWVFFLLSLVSLPSILCPVVHAQISLRIKIPKTFSLL